MNMFIYYIHISARYIAYKMILTVIYCIICWLHVLNFSFVIYSMFHHVG